MVAEFPLAARYWRTMFFAVGILVGLTTVSGAEGRVGGCGIGLPQHLILKYFYYGGLILILAESLVHKV